MEKTIEKTRIVYVAIFVVVVLYGLCIYNKTEIERLTNDNKSLVLCNKENLSFIDKLKINDEAYKKDLKDLIELRTAYAELEGQKQFFQIRSFIFKTISNNSRKEKEEDFWSNLTTYRDYELKQKKILLALSITEVESGFKNVVSPTDDHGYFQINKITLLRLMNQVSGIDNRGLSKKKIIKKFMNNFTFQVICLNRYLDETLKITKNPYHIFRLYNCGLRISEKGCHDYSKKALKVYLKYLDKLGNKNLNKEIELYNLKSYSEKK